MDLLDLRKEIDSIDEQLIPLLLKRMSISEQVAKYKVERGIPVLNAEREQQILDNVAEKCGAQGDTIKTVFSATMDASRALQHKIIGGGKVLRDTITNAMTTGKLTANGEPVACQGVDGAYSGVTAKQLFPDSPVKFYKQFEDVFESVNKGEAKFGVIPVENSTAGSVHESYDLIMKYRFYVVGAYDLKIEHCLCAKEGTKYEDISDVYSHPQALSQCNNFLKNFDFTGINFTNTAAAAKFVAESNKNDIAVICSELAAKKYGLKILKRNVQNNNNNMYLIQI
ncbi:MAG: chorismate mutase, partial [Eubacterium sp.]|nr:chorismate mutase [Eubacterium sp.]